MESKCGFCLTKLKKNEGINVKELVIDTNSRIVKFTDVLFELFYCEVDVSKICSECMDSVNKQYLFKEKLKKVIKMPLPKHIEVIRKVQKFIMKNDENLSVVTHLNILSVVPESKKTVMESIQNFNPEVQLTRTNHIPLSVPKKNNEQKKVKTANSITPPELNSSSNRSLFYFDNEFDDQEYTNSDSQDDYGKQPSKRKKKTKSKGRIPKKKQKSINGFQLVKKQPFSDILKITNQQNPKQFDSDNRSTVNSYLLNSTRLTRTLNHEKQEWLSMMLAKTKRSRSEYECSICSKCIKTHYGISYHYIYCHYLKSLSCSKIWVSQKTRDGSNIIKNENGGTTKIFQCTECNKNFNSQPALRYHLVKHLKNDASDDEFCVNDSSENES